MTSNAVPTAPPPAARRLEVSDCIVVPPSALKTAIRGAAVGNFMEWYDFGVYGYLAVTMTSVFTHGLDERVGLLVTLLGFAVSFLVRPLGGIVLGGLGDRIGRQRVLFMTMAIMATATALIGMLPTASQVGLWVIIPLYLLKMCQGFSTGGEYSGATTYVSEFSPDKDRGFWGGLLDVGSYLGFAAGASVVAITSAITTSAWGPTAMVDFGWRIPFLLAVPLGAIAIYFRMKIPETPSFEVAADEPAAAHDPDDPIFARHGMLGIIRHHWRAILIGIPIAAGSMSVSYALTSYMPTYLETEVGISNLSAAIATVPCLIVLSVSLPFVGRLSDRIGRRPVYGIAVVLTLALTVPAFALMHIGQMWAVAVALAMITIPTTFFVAINCATIPALFPTASRFGAMGFTWNIAVSVFGGTTPLISQALIEVTGNDYMPAFYVMLLALLAGIALIPMKETARRPLLGSVPTVMTVEEAQELVDTQDNNPLIDTSLMLLGRSKGANSAA